jgi:hypothetical protein
VIQRPLDSDDIFAIAVDGVRIERVVSPSRVEPWSKFSVRAHLEPRTYVFEIPATATLAEAAEIVARKAREMRGRVIVEYMLRDDWDAGAGDEGEEQELERAMTRIGEWLLAKQNGPRPR